MQTENDLQSSPAPSDPSATDKAKEQAQQATEQAREKATEAKDQAKSKLRSQVDQRSTQAGEKLSSTVQDVRSVGEELRNQGNDSPARLADQVAEKGEQLASYLQSADADRLMSDIEGFARRNAWAVAAGGAVLGFAASRVLKASGEQRSTQTRALPPAGTPGYTTAPPYGSGLPATPPPAEVS